MLPQSHMIMAGIIYENIRRKFNLNLNKMNLTYGSVIPDIPFQLSGLPHFKPESFDIICNKIHQLSQADFTKDKNSLKILSRDIGIVTHYIADYFCVPHNDRQRFKDDFISHIQYENNLHKLYKTRDPRVFIKKPSFNAQNNSANDIMSILNRLHFTYLSREPSLMNDFKSSIHATNLVAFYIIFHAMKKSLYYSVA